MGKQKNLAIEHNEEYAELKKKLENWIITREIYSDEGRTELADEADLHVVEIKARLIEIEKELAELSKQPQPGSED